MPLTKFSPQILGRDRGAGGKSGKIMANPKIGEIIFLSVNLLGESGAAGKTRTFNLLIRSQMLYPIELRLLLGKGE